MIESKLVKEEEKTPLQIKLEEIAGDIGKLGTVFAMLTVTVLLLRFLWEGLTSRNIDLFGGEEHAPEEGCSANGCFLKYVGDIFRALIIGIVIIVVAVPEGLPLAVMISLAFSIGQMLKDKCEVKKLASCEIMGGANNICSDKTGTLTNNVMEVVQLYSDKNYEMPTTVMTEKDDKGEVKISAEGKLTKLPVACDLSKLGFNANFKEKLIEGICLNVPEDKLSPTDEAMTYLMRAGEGEGIIAS
jgi:magnesium-transporting ATPase (P-type)